MMPTPFSKTLRSLRESSLVSAIARLAGAIVLLAALAYWMLRVPVSVFETSSDARLEVDSAASSIQAEMTGRVVECDLALGKVVHKGDVLVRLDSNSEQLQVREQETRMDALQPEINGLQAQIGAEESAGADERRASQAAIDESTLKVREAETPALAAEKERHRAEELRREGVISEQDLEKAISEAERLRASVATLHSGPDRLAREQITRDRQRAVRIAELQTQIAKLEQGRAGVTASIQRADYDVDRRVLRAPVDGVIGEAVALTPGSVLQEGAHVASIIPAGKLRIVAFFPPQAAHGHMHTGSPARLRLTGYPWTEFGVVEARVAEVAGEDAAGKTRVELEVLPSPTLRATLRHGMPGELEVETERITPMALVMRSSGQWITQPPGGQAR
jgi:multidrug resistance efflux pump